MTRQLLSCSVHLLLYETHDLELQLPRSTVSDSQFRFENVSTSKKGVTSKLRPLELRYHGPTDRKEP